MESPDEEPQSSPGPGRKRKFSDEELRSRMLDAAVEELIRTGVASGLESIRLDKIVVMAEVPRGAAYKMWDHPERTPQEQLRQQVVVHVLSDATGRSGSPTRDFTLNLIAELADDINSDDIARRRSARGEISRQVSKFNHDRLNSAMWKIYRSLAGSTTTRPTLDPDILAALEDGERRLVDTYVDLIEEFASVMRMQPKPGLTIRQFVMSIIALNDGLANHTTEAFGASHQHVVAEDGKEWTLYGIGCEALYEAFFDFV